jgi:hypothetical protein
MQPHPHDDPGTATAASDVHPFAATAAAAATLAVALAGAVFLVFSTPAPTALTPPALVALFLAQERT